MSDSKTDSKNQVKTLLSKVFTNRYQEKKDELKKQYETNLKFLESEKDKKSQRLENIIKVSKGKLSQSKETSSDEIISIMGNDIKFVFEIKEEKLEDFVNGLKEKFKYSSSEIYSIILWSLVNKLGNQECNPKILKWVTNLLLLGADPRSLALEETIFSVLIANKQSEVIKAIAQTLDKLNVDILETPDDENLGNLHICLSNNCSQDMISDIAKEEYIWMCLYFYYDGDGVDNLSKSLFSTD